MNRQEMVMKAAARIHGAFDDDYPHAIGVQRLMAAGEAVLDDLFPQVTTAEELEALPDDTVLVRDEEPHLFRLGSRISRHFASKHLPLTVVWTPGGAA